MKLNGTYKIYIGALVVVLLLSAALFAMPASFSAPALSQWQDTVRGAVAWIKPANAKETHQETVHAAALPDIEASIFSDMRDEFSDYWIHVNNVTGSFWNDVQGKSARIWHAIRSIPVSIGRGITSLAGSIGEGVRGVGTSIGNGFKAVFTSIGDGVMGVVTSIENGVNGTFSVIGNMGHGVVHFTGNIIDGITNHIVTRSKLLWGWGSSGCRGAEPADSGRRRSSPAIDRSPHGLPTSPCGHRQP